MHRFYLPPAQCHGPTLVLNGGEAHHALRVLRVKPGERVTVLDGAGQEFHCEVADAPREIQRSEERPDQPRAISRGKDKRSVQLHVLDKTIHPPRDCHLTLLQAVPKGKILESIIEKATELGVHRIVPLLTDRVTTRLDDESAAEKGAKWQHVAIEASKQCGAVWLPKVEALVTLKEFLARNESFDLALVGALQGEARHPQEYLRAFEMDQGRRPRCVAMWIGPEGDFTLAELQAIQGTGAKPITLGKLVLRVETAAIYCVSFLNYELQWPARQIF